MTPRWLPPLLLVLATACASSTPADEDAAPGAPHDAAPGAPHDAAPGQLDAGVDAAVAATPRPGAEIVSGAGRVHAGSRTLDVTIGHAIEQDDASAGTRRLTGATVVYP